MGSHRSVRRVQFAWFFCKPKDIGIAKKHPTTVAQQQCYSTAVLLTVDDESEDKGNRSPQAGVGEDHHLRHADLVLPLPTQGVSSAKAGRQKGRGGREKEDHGES